MSLKNTAHFISVVLTEKFYLFRKCSFINNSETTRQVSMLFKIKYNYYRQRYFRDCSKPSQVYGFFRTNSVVG